MDAGRLRGDGLEYARWQGSIPTKEGTMETILTIKPGTALIGKVQAGEHECEIADGKMIGGQISFTMKIGRGTVRYAGEVSANEMMPLVCFR